jgi:hypothetical protein
LDFSAQSMAYLQPHFNPDVFVSYSHGDPRATGEKLLKDWTRAVIAMLDANIHNLSTEFDELNLWIDEHIDPTSFLTDELRGKVKASGILMIVMSERYLGSTWCNDERDWFHEQIQDRAADQGRVFVVHAQRTDQNAWPRFLRDDRGHGMVGFPLFDLKTGRPLGWPDPRAARLEIQEALTQLETKLILRLRELRDRAVKRAAPKDETPHPSAPQGGQRLIYLHAASQDAPADDDIRRALSKDGFIPLTVQAAGGDLEGWGRDSGARIEAAKRCEALALLRAKPEDRFVGDLIDVGVNERGRIETARRSPLPCAVLDKTGVALPIDVKQFGIERFDLSQDAWPNDFRRWLDAARTSRAAAAPT